MTNKWFSEKDLKRIARTAADAIAEPGAFTFRNLSVNASGRAASVYSNDAVARSADGWVIKKAYDALEQRRRTAAAEALEDINKMIIALVGSSLVTLSDDVGRRAAIAALRLVGAEEDEL